MTQDFVNFDFNNPISTVPAEYATALDIQLPGFWDQYAMQDTGTNTPWWETAAKVASTLIMANYQREMLNVQLDRAQKGLPPIDAAQYGIGVNVGLSANTQKLLLFGAIAIGGLALFMSARR